MKMMITFFIDLYIIIDLHVLCLSLRKLMEFRFFLWPKNFEKRKNLKWSFFICFI